jgi:hypothetical protein
MSNETKLQIKVGFDGAKALVGGDAAMRIFCIFFGRSRYKICDNRLADDTLPDKICNVPLLL